ncbi:hypothetical protein QAD02_016534 [Eretmocerus hayati]|uniref:Uncharacterized protein n=1 Tax=Eretmocerus hayati TaxID=131215 RepID=A0ACC2PBC7_9HYME|nr:hypothetical protein QAD02_016534 [Eretmocerus hayati]
MIFTLLQSPSHNNCKINLLRLYHPPNKTSRVKVLIDIFYDFRTKWKRQTIVGYEIMAETGNFAAFQRLYSAAGVPLHPGASPYWPYPAAAAAAAHHAQNDLLYRQAASAAAVTLQKPMPYRLYPPSAAAAMMLAGPSAAGVGPLGASLGSGAPGLSGPPSYYPGREPPSPPSGGGMETLSETRERLSPERTTPSRESPAGTPASLVNRRSDSDDESIHDV